MPGAPTGLVATAGNTSVNLAFVAPSTGAISSYTASCAPTGAGAVLSATGSASPLTMSGLTNGTLYTCTVSASSTGGTSTASTSATVIPSAVAGALTLNLTSLSNYAAPTLPAYYDATVTALDNTPPANVVNNKTATLGRVLFYDKNLSFNNTVSCASCHQAAAGFSDPARFSTGFSGSAFTTAHSMRLGNIRYYRPGSMFWDKRTASVELQASQPIQNAIEMGFDATHGSIAALLPKLQVIGYYQELFTFAFGDANVTEARIQNALAQFERSMVSVNSAWDTGFASVFNPALTDQGRSLPVPGLTAQEDRGRALFMGGPGVGVGCAACHVPPTFSLAANSLSNGLDAGETRIFKSPSLKSVGVSGAFMHDGRFSTLDQVVDFYNNGVQAGPALDPRLTAPSGAPRVLNLSVADKAALVAFLRALTDTTLATDTKFLTPFKP